MIKRIVVAAILALFLVGCGNSGAYYYYTAQPLEVSAATEGTPTKVEFYESVQQIECVTVEARHRPNWRSNSTSANVGVFCRVDEFGGE